MAYFPAAAATLIVKDPSLTYPASPPALNNNPLPLLRVQSGVVTGEQAGRQAVREGDP